MRPLRAHSSCRRTWKRPMRATANPVRRTRRADPLADLLADLDDIDRPTTQTGAGGPANPPASGTATQNCPAEPGEEHHASSHVAGNTGGLVRDGPRSEDPGADRRAGAGHQHWAVRLRPAPL